MKNLFDYATKELSQDAFLLWLFDNWREEDLVEPIMDMFHAFGVKLSYEEITNISVFKQISKIDVSVVIENIHDRPILLIIEDKTDSNAHDNQLLKYDSHIFGGPLDNGDHDFSVLEKLNRKIGRTVFLIPDTKRNIVSNVHYDVIRVFYKTFILSDEDKRFLSECKNLPTTFSAYELADPNGWKIFDIYDIYNLLEKHKTNSNILFNMYVNHLIDIYNNITNTEMPTTDNANDWFLYFNNAIKPYFIEKGYIVEVWNWTGRDPGIGIKLKSEGCDPSYFDSSSNERLYIQFTYKCLTSKYFKLVLTKLNEGETYNIDTLKALKAEIEREHEVFNFPMKVYDSENSNIVARVKLPCDTTEEMINSFETVLKQLEFIDHDLKMV